MMQILATLGKGWARIAGVIAMVLPLVLSGATRDIAIDLVTGDYVPQLIALIGAIVAAFGGGRAVATTALAPHVDTRAATNAGIDLKGILGMVLKK